jgi:hypothetical protein
MQKTDLLSRLLPSIPEIHKILLTIREKYDLPEVLPENEQLAQLLLESEFYDWEAIRKDIENELRTWFQPVSSDLDNTVQLFMMLIDKSPDIRESLMSETIGIAEPEAAKFVEEVNNNALSGLTMLDHYYIKGSEKLLDHLITGRPMVLPKEWANPVLSVTLPPGEKFVIAVAHQLSDPDELSEKFRQRMKDTFGEEPKIKADDLDTAEYLSMKITGKTINDIVLLYLERHPDAIPYRKGTKKYNEALRKLKDNTRQKLHRLQQDIKQIVGRDKK